MTKTEKILATVKAHEASVTGTLGFAFLDFKTGENCYLQENTAFPTASVFKIFLLAELYRQVEQGKLRLEDTITADPAEISGGSGVLKRFRHAANLTLYNHAVLMMAISDNTATDLLFDLVGADAIQNDLLAALGLENTEIPCKCHELIGNAKIPGAPYNFTTPKEMVKTLQALHGGTLLTPEHSEEVLELMQPIPKYNRLEKYLPHGTKIRRKTGSLVRVVNDTGIVFTEKGDYAIAVFYNGNTADPAEYEAEKKKLLGEELIALISRDVYNIFMED